MRLFVFPPEFVFDGLCIAVYVLGRIDVETICFPTIVCYHGLCVAVYVPERAEGMPT